MKSKKLISLLCAAALTISSFAGLIITASAAEGDVLHTSTFEDAASKTTEVYKAPAWNDDQTAATTRDVTRVTAWEGNNWGVASDARSAAYYGSATDAVAYMTDMIGSQRVNDTTVWTDTFKPTTVTPPAVTGEKSLYVATQTGMNPTVTLTIAPAVTAAATNAYSVNFDMMLASGDYDGTKTGKKEYTASIADIFKLDVIDDDLYFMDGTTRIDTGIDLTLAGTWFNFDLVFDTNGKQFKGTIKAYDGDTLAATAACDIPWSNFAGNATTIDKAVFAAVRDSSGQKGAVNCAIDNFVVKEAAAVTYTDVTIKYVDGEGATLKDATTAKAETGTTFTASEAYKVPFTTDELRAENKYYKYTGTTDSVEAAEGAEISLVFTETAMPKGTVKAAVDGVAVAEAFSGYAMPGEKVSGYLSEYIADAEGNWYVKNNGVQTYPADVTLNDTDTESLVAYKPVKGVVSFKEAESDEGITDGTYSTNYPQIYASGGQWVQSASSGNYNVGFYTDAVETEGEYEVTVRFYDNSGRPMAVAKVAEDGTMEKIGETTNGKGLREESFTAVLAAGEKFWVGKTGDIGTDVASDTKAIDDVDYIVVKKVSATPEVEVAYSDNKATLTVTNADDVFENVNAKLIHASYADGAVSAVNVYDAPLTITADGMGAEVTIPETDAVYKNDKFMVWDSVEGMKPLSAIYIVTEGEDPVVPTPTPAPTDVPTEPTPTPAPTDVPTYSVTVDTAIVNGTVTAAPAANVSAGDTVTLTVTPNTGYVVGEVKYNDTAITADADGVYSFTMPAANVTVTATFTQLPAMTGTVTVSGTVQEQETLTATVEGAPEGATLKYQWMTAATVDGEYTATSGATKSTRKIATGSAGKYIKVVVTADGYRGSIESAPQGPIAQAEQEATKYGITASADPVEGVTEIKVKVGDDEVTEAEEGASVTIAATAAEGYQITSVTTDDVDTTVTKNDDGTYSFEMPAKAVAVTVNTVAVYSITKGTETNGTFNVSKTVAKANDEISVTNISAAEGYAVGAVKYNSTEIVAVDGAYKFTMPSEAVTVTVEFVKKQYAVTITAPDTAQGTLTVNKTGEGTPAVSTGDKLAWGDTFTVTATAAAGYENPVVKVMNGSSEITATDGVYTMPKAAVTISVTFTKTQYSVTVAQVQNGTVKVMLVEGEGEDATETELNATALADVEAGKKLKVVATANDGYAVGGIAVTKGEETVTVTDGAFTMPAGSVTVTVTIGNTHFFNQTGTFATPSGRGTTISLDGSTRKYNQTDKNASMTIDTFTEAVDLSGDTNTLEFDAKFYATSSRTDKSAQVMLSLVNSDNKVLLGIGRTGILSNSNDTAKELMYYAGGAVTEGRGDPLWGVDENGSQAAPFNTDTAETAFSDINKTYHVKAVVTANELIVSVNPTDDATKVITKVADISSVGAKNLAKVKVYNDVSTSGIGNDNRLEISNETMTQTATYETVVNVKNAEDAAIAGATVTVGKRTATTDAEGKVTLQLPNGTYAYTVSCIGYQTKTDGSLTVAGAAVTETATLANSVPTSITITSPDVTQVTTDAGVQFTATVYDEENREMSNVPLTWSIVDDPANIAVTNGEVTATAGVAAGNYTVKVAVTANADVSATATFSVVTAAATKITVKYMVAGATDPVKTEEITENVYVGESYTMADSYKDTFTVKDTEAGTFKRYTYVSGELTLASPVANNNDVVITVATDGVDYYFYEDFASYDAVPAAWVGSGVKALETGGYLSTKYDGSGSRNSTYMFGDDVTGVTGGILKISFKYNRDSLVTLSNRGDGQFAVIKKGVATPANNSLVAVGDTVWSIYGKGNNDTNNTNLYLPNWVVNDTTTVAGGTDGITYEDSANTIAFAKDTWYTVEIYADIDNNKTTYIVKDASGATIKAEYDLACIMTGIGGIHILAPRNGGKYGIDDITVAKASAMPINPTSTPEEPGEEAGE